MNLLQTIRARVAALQPGQCVAIEYHVMRELEPASPLAAFVTALGKLGSPADQILEGITGSAYEWRHSYNPETRATIFQRLKEPVSGQRRTYVSPDRRHLARETRDGFWEYVAHREPGAEFAEVAMHADER